MQPIIVIGDKTSHGGVVIQGSPQSDIDGKQIARVGDKVMCPQKGHGLTVIITGDPTTIVDGSPVALHGHKTSCGATLLSSQVTTYVDAGGGGGGQEGSRARSVVSADTTKAESAVGSKEQYDLRWQLKDEVNGKPLVNMPYRITMGTEQFFGSTTSEGFTQTVGANSPLMTEIEAPYYGDSTSGVDPDSGSESCCS